MNENEKKKEDRVKTKCEILLQKKAGTEHLRTGMSSCVPHGLELPTVPVPYRTYPIYTKDLLKIHHFA